MTTCPYCTKTLIEVDNPMRREFRHRRGEEAFCPGPPASSTPPPPHGAVTHIAGQNITISGRYLRQRCAWCDHILIDLDLTRVAVPTDQPGPPATWPVGALVTVDGGASWIDSESDRLPDNACAKPGADCPETFKCPRCRCILTAGHTGLCDVHCGRPARQEADRG